MEKNNKTLNVPNLRFPEFSGEWESTPISTIADIIGGGTPDTSVDEYWGGNIQWFTPSEIGKEKYAYLSDRTITEAGLKNSSAKLLPQGTVLLSTRATIGECSIATAECTTNQGFQSLVAKKNNVSSEFLYYIVAKIKREMLRRSCGSTFLEISANELKKIHANIPSKAEQEKLVSLLSLIDQRIETQKKIIEDLKKLKDAICNLNFTSGSVLKLENTGKFVRGLTYSASDVIDYTIGTAVMRSNNISNGDPVNFEELVWVNKTPNHEQILRSGDIVICMANGSSSLVGKASYYVDCGIESATVGAFCGIYRSDNPLTKWLFQSKHYKKHIQRCIQGGNGAIANIYPEDILAISFNIPCGYERVLNILNSLEEKYLLEQKLLSRYLGVKSYLLSRLFI